MNRRFALTQEVTLAMEILKGGSVQVCADRARHCARVKQSILRLLVIHTGKTSHLSTVNPRERHAVAPEVTVFDGDRAID